MRSIAVSHLTKTYHRYQRRSQTLKGAFVDVIRRRPRAAPGPVQRALEDVSFEVRAGTTFGVIGSNGSGKSTLLKVLAGILKPSSGTVEVRGRVGALIELGAGFHPEMTGRENVMMNGLLLGIERRELERRLPEIVAFAELEAFIDEPVKTYSSGMYVRLGFAVATAVDPDVLLVDEVLAVGDEAFSHKCIERFHDFKRRTKTIVLVTHSLDLVEALADEAMWLERGRLRARGYPREVLDAYRSEVSAHDARRLAEPDTAADEAAPIQTQADPRAPRRWGDGRVRIEEVRLLDAQGAARLSFTTGEPVTIELQVAAVEPIEDFVFGVGFFSDDGACVYGTNTEIEGYRARRLSGRARVRVGFPTLSLLEGRYALDVAVHSAGGAAYDYRLGALAFRMSSARREAGAVRLAHSWELDGDIRLEAPSDSA